MTGMNGGAGGRGIAGTFPRRARVASIRVAMIGLLGGSVCVLASCGRDEGQAGPPSAAVALDESKPEAAEAADAATSAYSDEDRAACEELTRHLAEALEAGDAAGIDVLVDIEGYLDRLFEGVDTREGEARNFRAGVVEGMKRQSFGERWVADGAKVLRLREIDGRPAVLTRAVAEDGAGVYIDLLPHRMPDGSFRIVDGLNHALGEKLSETGRRFLMPILGDLGRPALLKAFGEKDPFVEHFDAAVAFLRDASGGNPAGAIRRYAELPVELRERKEFLVAYLGCLSVDDPQMATWYGDAVERYMQLYSADSSAGLLAIDYHYLRGNHGEALAALAKLTKTLGEDAWLASLAAAIYSEMGRHPEARAAAERAVELEPDFEDAWFTLADVCVAAGDHVRVVEALDVLEGDEFGHDLSGLAVVSEYEDFMATEEGKEWWESRERMNPEDMLPE